MLDNLSTKEVQELVNSQGSITGAAKTLGIPYRTLHSWCTIRGIIGQKPHLDWLAIQEDLNAHIPVREICTKHNISRACFDSAGIRRNRIVYPPQYGLANNGRKIAATPTKYNWVDIQRDYDAGHSYADLKRVYGVSIGTLNRAKNNGWLKPRTSAEAVALKRKLLPESFHRYHTDESKQRIRESINKRYANGWMPKAGRCKKYKHISPIAGEVTLDGTWEVYVAKWLDSVGIQWRRNTQRFDYVGLTGEPRTYTPDFYITEFDVFVEVKGYETELDALKWSHFPHVLLVWKKKHLDQLVEGELNGVFDNAC